MALLRELAWREFGDEAPPQPAREAASPTAPAAKSDPEPEPEPERPDPGVVALPEAPYRKEWFYADEITCPVSGTRFQYLRTRQGAVRPVSRESDFRIEYRDLDPGWYAVIVCPRCSFAAYPDDFGELERIRARRATSSPAAARRLRAPEPLRRAHRRGRSRRAAPRARLLRAARRGPATASRASPPAGLDRAQSRRKRGGAPAATRGARGLRAGVRAGRRPQRRGRSTGRLCDRRPLAATSTTPWRARAGSSRACACPSSRTRRASSVWHASASRTPDSSSAASRTRPDPVRTRLAGLRERLSDPGIATPALALVAIVSLFLAWPAGSESPELEGRLAVADLRGHALILIDLEDTDTATRLALPGAPHELVELPDGRIVASLPRVGALAIVDISGDTEIVGVGGIPHGLALSDVPGRRPDAAGDRPQSRPRTSLLSSPTGRSSSRSPPAPRRTRWLRWTTARSPSPSPTPTTRRCRLATGRSRSPRIRRRSPSRARASRLRARAAALSRSSTALASWSVKRRGRWAAGPGRLQRRLAHGWRRHCPRRARWPSSTARGRFAAVAVGGTPDGLAFTGHGRWLLVGRSRQRVDRRRRCRGGRCGCTVRGRRKRRGPADAERAALARLTSERSAPRVAEWVAAHHVRIGTSPGEASIVAPSAGTCSYGGGFLRRGCGREAVTDCVYCDRPFCADHGERGDHYMDVCARKRCQDKLRDVEEHNAWKLRAEPANKVNVCANEECDARLRHVCSRCRLYFCEAHVRERRVTDNSQNPPVESYALMCKHCEARQKLWR